MQRLLSALFLLVLMTAVGCASHHTHDNHTLATSANDRPPNVVIFFNDDQGYGDLSCYGHPTLHTPHIDRMASEGMKLTQFYVSQPLCSPSRTSLLTGSYAKRVSMHKHVIFPQYDYGLHTDEWTIADMLKAEGYATACFGKWHLGHRPGLLPTDQGFDEYFGVPYSNDMSTFHRPKNTGYKYNLPLMRGYEVIEWEPDQRLLTKRFTEEALRFIDENKDKPFFLYLPNPMPHIPIYASEDFEGNSNRGLYGDVIEEIDWSVGEVLKALKQHGLDEDTIVMFSSDNGHWAPFKENGGTAGPLRGAKGTNFEGGHRTPMIVRWPGKVPAGSVSRQVVTAMDILPTLAEITGGELSDKKIDGGDVSAILLGKPNAKPTTDTYLYYTNRGDLAGIRQGPYKLLFAGNEAKGGPYLYHLEHDISELWDLAKKQPQRVEQMQALAIKLDEQITAEMRPTRKVNETLWEWPNIKSDDPNPNLQGR